MLKVLTAVALTVLGLAAMSAGPADAKRPPCARGEVAIADDRPRGDKLCLSKIEATEAKRICGARRTAKGKRVNWKDCLCQDGDTVGACGD